MSENIGAASGFSSEEKESAKLTATVGFVVGGELVVGGFVIDNMLTHTAPEDAVAEVPETPDEGVHFMPEAMVGGGMMTVGFSLLAVGSVALAQRARMAFAERKV